MVSIKSPVAVKVLDALHAAAEEAARIGDQATHDACHLAEMKLRDARCAMMEAQKVANEQARWLLEGLLADWMG